MIVKFFEKTYPITIIVIIFIAIITQLPVIIFPENFFEIDFYSPISNFLLFLFDFSPLTTSVILLLCFLACLFLISRVNTNNLLISKGSLLPPIMFVLLFQFRLYDQSLIANMLILLAINRLLLISTKDSEDYTEVDFFGAGFMVGVATLTNLPSVIYLLFIIIAVFILNKQFKFRDILIIITGFTLPIFIWLFIEFAIGDLLNIAETSLSPLKANFELFQNNLSTADYFSVIYLTILIISSIVFVSSRLYNMNIALRKKFQFFIIILIVSLILVAVFNHPTSYLMMSLPILSIMLSYILSNIKTVWADILFILIALLPSVFLLLTYVAA